MGLFDNFNTDPAIPPLSIKETLPIQWDFIQENSPWPFIHVVLPFYIYIHTRSFWITIFLVFLNEQVEALIVAIIPGVTDGVASGESRQDSMVSDPLMGYAGIIMAFLFLKYIKWEWRFSLYYSKASILSGRKGGVISKQYFNYTRFFKYLFQFLCIYVPHASYAAYFDTGGVFSIGQPIVFLCTIIVTPLFYLWNQDDELQRNLSSRSIGAPYETTNLGYGVIIEYRNQKNIRGAKWFYFYVTLSVCLFRLSFFYLYTHCFIQTIIHCLIFIIIFVCLLLYDKIKIKSTSH